METELANLTADLETLKGELAAAGIPYRLFSAVDEIHRRMANLAATAAAVKPAPKIKPETSA